MDADEIRELFQAQWTSRDVAGYPHLEVLSAGLESDELDPYDWGPLEALADLYEWSLTLTVVLEDGEVRRRWCSGSHDDSNMVDNMPHASLCVPRPTRESAARNLRVDGWVLFRGVKPAVRMEWSCDLAGAPREAGVALAARSLAEEPAVGAVTQVAVDTRAITVDTGDAVVACLPEVGLVTRRSDHTGYRLHTPTGSIDLTGVRDVLAALPGRATFPPVERVVGGPRGRLAMHVQRFAGTDRDGYSRYEHHRVIFELPSQRVLAHAKPDADGQGAGVGDGGGFDARGAADETGKPTDAAVDEPRWPTDYIDMDLGGRGEHAHHRGAQVSAWEARDGAGAFASRSVCVFHPSWGVRQYAVAEGGGPLAVLADGRVLTHDERLHALDPATGRVTDVGPIGYAGPTLLVDEREAETVVWTYDPAHWRVRWARGAE